MILDYYSKKTTAASKFVDIELVEVFLQYTDAYTSVNEPKAFKET
jgi:hypothetical protein